MRSDGSGEAVPLGKTDRALRDCPPLALLHPSEQTRRGPRLRAEDGGTRLLRDNTVDGDSYNVCSRTLEGEIVIDRRQFLSRSAAVAAMAAVPLAFAKASGMT